MSYCTTCGEPVGMASAGRRWTPPVAVGLVALVLVGGGVLLGTNLASSNDEQTADTQPVEATTSAPVMESTTRIATTTEQTTGTAPTPQPVQASSACPSPASGFEPARPVMCVLDLWSREQFDDMHPYAVGEVIADMRGLDPTGASDGLVGVEPNCVQGTDGTANCLIINTYFELRFSVEPSDDEGARVFRIEVIRDESGI